VEFIESNYETVYFEYDQSRLTAEARRILGKNADMIRGSLEKHPELKILIEGHCDERGTNEYNLALGERRAFSARDYLISLGTPAAALFTKSWGEEKPVDPGHSEKAWARNRRAEFSVYKGE
jgi:peptidoglycan-associated lipoprotein